MAKAAKQAFPVVGLDIGYGEVKVYDGTQTFTFPAVWGRASEALFETAATQETYAGDDIYDDEGHWLVGYKAMKHIAPAALRNLRGRTMDEEQLAHHARLRLAKAAFGKLFPTARNGDVIHIHLATGLPVSHMAGREAFKQLLSGAIPVKTEQADFVVHVARCFVMPQPYGTLYRQMMQSDGTLNPHFTASRTAILDCGTYTIDAALDDEGEYIDQRSDSIEAGVYTIQRALEVEYERRHFQKPSYTDIERGVKTGFIKVRGEPDDFTAVRQRAGDDMANAALNLVSRVWQAGADIDLILVTGGGAVFVMEKLKGQYAQAVLVDSASTANAEGYRRYALNELVAV